MAGSRRPCPPCRALQTAPAALPAVLHPTRHGGQFQLQRQQQFVVVLALELGHRHTRGRKPERSAGRPSDVDATWSRLPCCARQPFSRASCCTTLTDRGQTAHVEQPAALARLCQFSAQRGQRRRVVAQRAGSGDERRIVGDIHPRQPQMVVEAAGHARRTCRRGRSAPGTGWRVGRGGVGAIRMRVEEQVGQLIAGQILRMRQFGHEHQPRWVQASGLCGAAQAGVGMAGGRTAPQHAAGHRLQHCEERGPCCAG